MPGSVLCGVGPSPASAAAMARRMLTSWVMASGAGSGAKTSETGAKARCHAALVCSKGIPQQGLSGLRSRCAAHRHRPNFVERGGAARRVRYAADTRDGREICHGCARATGSMSNVTLSVTFSGCSLASDFDGLYKLLKILGKVVGAQGLEPWTR